MENSFLTSRFFISCAFVVALILVGSATDFTPVALGTGPETNCTNNMDDDEDLLVDCGDDDCATHPSCTNNPIGETNCTNEQDDDVDLLVDCGDDDCAIDPACM